MLDYDVIVVGSGFGGSVAALRLSEKGYRVAVLEAGQALRRTQACRVAPGTCGGSSGRPCSGASASSGCISCATPWCWPAPASVAARSTTPIPSTSRWPAFYRDPQWASITDWRAELAPCYDQAKRMLGSTENPALTPADEVMLSVASEMGAGGHLPDGPRRRLVRAAWSHDGPRGRARRPVLWRGRAGPAGVHPVRGVHDRVPVRRQEHARRPTTSTLPSGPAPRCTRSGPSSRSGRWPTEVGRWARRAQRPLGLAAAAALRAGQVVLAAGTLGTQRLLHRMAWEGKLPGLSRAARSAHPDQLRVTIGRCGPQAAAREGAGERDFTRGVAITSSFYPDPATHGRARALRAGLEHDGLVRDAAPAGGRGRQVAGMGRAGGLRGPSPVGGAAGVRLAGLVGAHRDRTCDAGAGQLAHRLRKTWPSRQAKADKPAGARGAQPHVVACWPRGRPAAGAGRSGARPQGTWGEIFGVPMTAHFLGGCVIGASSSEGVVDPWQRVHGHAGLHIVDGSVVPANPGANPALTITALAERALSYWPNRGDPDPRPPLGAPYERLVPVSPRWPAVPVGAPGSLHLSTANRLPAT